MIATLPASPALTDEQFVTIGEEWIKAQRMSRSHLAAFMAGVRACSGTHRSSPSSAGWEIAGYRYLYPHYSGGTVWRFNEGQRVNGSAPIRGEAVYVPVSPPLPEPPK